MKWLRVPRRGNQVFSLHLPGRARRTDCGLRLRRATIIRLTRQNLWCVCGRCLPLASLARRRLRAEFA